MRGHHFVRSLALLLLPAIFAFSQDQPAPGKNTTTLTVTVTDRDHHPVTALPPESFTLSEDGQQQAISSVASGDVPLCVGLLIDRSGSMRGRHAAIAAAMGEFVRAGNPGNLYFAALFNDSALLQEDFTHDAAAIEQAISSADARGGTAFYEAVIASADHLAERKGCAKRVLALVTDGIDNESKPTLEQTVRALNEDGNPLVYAIGLPEKMASLAGRGKHALQALTTPGGGEAILLGDFGDIRKAAHRIADELRSQYSLTYTPAGTGLPQPKVSAHAQGGKALAVTVNIAHEPVIRAKATPPSSATPAPAAAPSAVPAAVLPMHLVGCISGSVVDQGKRPVPGTSVKAWPVFSGNSYSTNSYPQTTTDENGKFKFPDLQAGNYILYTKNEEAGYPPTENSLYREGIIRPVSTEDKCADVVVKLGPKAARLKVSAIDEVTHEPITRFGFAVRSSSGVLSFRWAQPGQEILVPANAHLTVAGWSPPRYLMTQPVEFSTGGPESSGELIVKLHARTQASPIDQQDK
jgi:VWFA-related protein